MKGSLTKIFGTVRKSLFDKIVIHHLMQFLYSRIFLKKSVPLGVFSVVWDKKVLRESRDIPLLSINFFDQRNFLKNEGFPYEFSRYCEKIIIRQNCDTPSYKNFFKPDIFWKTSVPLLIFSVLWDKKVSRESRDFPLLAIKFFDKRKILKKERFSFEKFRYCEKINFRQNRGTTSYAIYLIQKFSEKKGPTRSFFGTVRQKFREKVVISPCYP